MKNNTYTQQLMILSILFAIFTGCDKENHTSQKLYYSDAHSHLTTYGEGSIDSLNKYGVIVVRDCGGDTKLLKKWRDEINSGKRKGPKIYFSGPIVDGREEENIRAGVYSADEAEQVIDSLSSLGVDFIKTHASLSSESYFGILRAATAKNLSVVSHMPPTVPVWQAANSGLSSIEHAAESFLTAPKAAGYVKTEGDSAISDAIRWWRSSKGDSIIKHLGELKIFFTPTLFSYKVWATQGTSQEEINSRFKVLEFLKEITLKLHQAGVIILAGTDLYDTSWQNEIPGKSLYDEIKILEEAGLTKQEAFSAATINLQTWIDRNVNQ